MNLTSVIKTSSETFSLILLINKVSVVIVISKSLRNGRSFDIICYDHVRFLQENMTTAVYKI